MASKFHQGRDPGAEAAPSEIVDVAIRGALMHGSRATPVVMAAARIGDALEALTSADAPCRVTVLPRATADTAARTVLHEAGIDCIGMLDGHGLDEARRLAGALASMQGSKLAGPPPPGAIGSERDVVGWYKETYHPDRAEFDELAEAYGKEEFEKLGHHYDDAFVLHRGAGCANCNKTGYRGRAGIHELMVAADEIKRLIQAKARVPEMVASAKSDGMTTLVQDGILKSRQGLTDFRQVKAVAIK